MLSGSRAIGLRSVVVVAVLLNDDVTVAVMRAIYRAADNDSVGAMVTAAVVVKCNLAMAVVMETMSVPIYDQAVVVIPMMMLVMSVGVDDDGVLCRSNGWSRQAKRQRA